MKVQRIINHGGLLTTHLALQENTPTESVNVLVKLGRHPCSCGHLHPWAVGESGFSVEYKKGYCKICNSYRDLIVQGERLVMDSSNCETCRLLACIH